MGPTRPSHSGLILAQAVPEEKRERARELRSGMTGAEAVLWEALRGKRLEGLKFRRQQLILGFIADFYCEALRLVVEVDGSVHDTQEQKLQDALKDEAYERRGLKVLRFSNEAVLNETEKVLTTIRAHIPSK
jgi:very-short-patch-repair endonuclease